MYRFLCGLLLLLTVFAGVRLLARPTHTGGSATPPLWALAAAVRAAHATQVHLARRYDTPLGLAHVGPSHLVWVVQTPQGPVEGDVPQGDDLHAALHALGITGVRVSGP